MKEKNKLTTKVRNKNYLQEDLNHIRHLHHHLRIHIKNLMITRRQPKIFQGLNSLDILEMIPRPRS